MIAYARSIPHGKMMTQYVTKNHRAEIVKTNLLTEGLPFVGIWEEMCLHMERFRAKHSRKPITNTSFDIEVSPTMEESKSWTLDDWARYTEEFVAQLDTMTKGVDRNGKIMTGLKPTNISNSQYFAALHRDAKSGIPHLHIVVNRIDCNGNTNDSNYIGERCALAAQIINRRHGWEDTMEIRHQHIKQINKDCWDILRGMKQFSWDEYFKQLKAKGYDISMPKTNGEMHGYSILMGNSCYRSSDLGKGRCFTASKIQKTFLGLHPELRVVLPHYPLFGRYMNLKAAHPNYVLLFHVGRNYEIYSNDAINTARVLHLRLETSNRYGDANGEPLKYVRFSEDELLNVTHRLSEVGFGSAVCDSTTSRQSTTEQPQQQNARSSTSNSTHFQAVWNIGDRDVNVDIPMSAYNTIDKEIGTPQNGNVTHDDVVKVAVLFFLNMVAAATTVAESYGGGGGTGSGWGRRKDDDDENWAKRCAARASWLCKPLGKSRSGKRGK